jgi:hypothetical protein
MARETKYTGILGDLQRLSGTMEANREELPHMEPFRLKLGGILTSVLEVSQEQSALKVRKQETSKRLRNLLTEGAAAGQRGAHGGEGALRRARGEGRRVRRATVPRPEIQGGAREARSARPATRRLRRRRQDRSLTRSFGRRARRASPFFAFSPSDLNQRSGQCLIVPSAFPSSPDDASSYAAQFRRTQRIFIVSRRRLAVRSAFPLSAAHSRRLGTTSRRTRRIFIVHSAFSSSADDGPLYAAHFRRTRRISIVWRRRPVVRGAFPLCAAHFHRLETTSRRTQRISVVRGAFPSSPDNGLSWRTA